MKPATARSLMAALALAWLATGMSARAAEPAEADASITVITNADHAQFALDRNLLRSLFTMRLREWPDGKPVRVFVLRDSDPVHDRFARQLLGTYPYVLRGAWDRQVFTGTGLAPTQVDSEEDMRRRVQSTPGAIGYVRAARTSSYSAAPTRVVLIERGLRHD